MNQFRARGFKPRTMHILNKCRMYLNIITVADITNPYGTHIVNKPLHGTKHKLSHLQWPRSPSPTPNDWKIWKSSIQRFLMLHASNVQYPLGPRNSHYHHQFFPAPPIQHFDFTDMTPQRYLRVILTMLPPQYTRILGKLAFHVMMAKPLPIPCAPVRSLQAAMDQLRITLQLVAMSSCQSHHLNGYEDMATFMVHPNSCHPSGLNTMAP